MQGEAADKWVRPANWGSTAMLPGPGGSGVVQEYSKVAFAQLPPWLNYAMQLYSVPPFAPPPELPVNVQL
jgi:hypothetical protein